MSNQKTIQVSDKMFTDPAKNLKFIRAFGRQRYLKALKNIAEQRIGTREQQQKLQKELEGLSREEYDKKREEILKQVQRPGKDKPVFVDVPLNMDDGDPSTWSDIRDFFGNDNAIFKTMGLDGVEFAHNKTYRQLTGVTHYVPGKKI